MKLLEDLIRKGKWWNVMLFLESIFIMVIRKYFDFCVFYDFVLICCVIGLVREI